MNREKISEWFLSVSMGVILICVSAVLLKLTYDFYTAPNIFIKEEPALEQKKIDEMCVAWWFESDLGSAKKRVCGK